MAKAACAAGLVPLQGVSFTDPFRLMWSTSSCPVSRMASSSEACAPFLEHFQGLGLTLRLLIQFELVFLRVRGTALALC